MNRNSLVIRCNNFQAKDCIEYLELVLSVNVVNIECFFIYLINISYCNSWCVAGLWEGVRVYSPCHFRCY